MSACAIGALSAPVSGFKGRLSSFYIEDVNAKSSSTLIDEVTHSTSDAASNLYSKRGNDLSLDPSLDPNSYGKREEDISSELNLYWKREKEASPESNLYWRRSFASSV